MAKKVAAPASKAPSSAVVAEPAATRPPAVKVAISDSHPRSAESSGAVSVKSNGKSNGAAHDGAAKQPVTDAAVAERAYYIFTSGAPGSQMDHWLQAERELRGM